MLMKLVTFDLDGTLVNTSPGIYNSVRFAESKMGLTPIPDSDLRKFVGPPPKKNYMELYGLSEEDAFEATKYHREYGSTKAFMEADVYEGIPELLDALKEAGYKLSVATLKNEKIAHQVLEHAGIADKFDTIVGMDDNESRTKCDTIHIGMQRTGCEDCVLIGDSQYDYEGALAAGVKFIGATYGFGFEPDAEYPFPVFEKSNDLTIVELISRIYEK